MTSTVLHLDEDSGMYSMPPTMAADEIIEAAKTLINQRFIRETPALSNPDNVKEYLSVKLSGYDYEVFSCLFLDSKNRVICFDELFHGTIDNTQVHAREVVRLVLRHNAAAVIFAHNHPSGVAKPSEADVCLTLNLRRILAVIDVNVLDHFVVGEYTTSLVSAGLIPPYK